MYKIVDYETNQSLSEIFNSFKEAFNIQQKFYPKYFIEYWFSDNDNPQIVWNPIWEIIYNKEEFIWNFNAEFADQ